MPRRRLSGKKGTWGFAPWPTKLNIDTIVVAIKEKRGELPTKELLQCRIDGIDVFDGISFYETLSGKLLVEHISPSWLIFSDGFQKSGLKKFLKRATDIILSVILLIILLPLNLLVMLLIRIDSKGPVFYSQDRVGEGHRIYRIYKFRSMFTDAEDKTGPVFTTKNDDRVTRVGRFFRKWRIDEIPQLWNVLQGRNELRRPAAGTRIFRPAAGAEIFPTTASASASSPASRAGPRSVTATGIRSKMRSRN